MGDIRPASYRVVSTCNGSLEISEHGHGILLPGSCCFSSTSSFLILCGIALGRRLLLHFPKSTSSRRHPQSRRGVRAKLLLRLLRLRAFSATAAAAVLLLMRARTSFRATTNFFKNLAYSARGEAQKMNDAERDTWASVLHIIEETKHKTCCIVP